MAASSGPKRIVSNPTNIFVVPAWVPDVSDGVGKFNNVYRADQPTQWHPASTIDPDLYMADGSRTPYPHVFSHPTYKTAFFMIWRAQNGATLNFELGALGSLLLFGGGHVTWGGCSVIRFDIASGMWSQMGQTIFCSTDRSIENGTVAQLTGTVSKRQSRDMTTSDRVSWWGNYIKTADDVPIPGAGDINGAGQEVIHPFPVHTNRGICTLPSEAGGGPLGSMLIWGHGQTGITIKTDKWQVFRFDCATKVWSAWQLGDRLTSQRPEPTLMYDSTRKLIWARGGSGRPQVLNYNTMTRDYPAGPSVNVSGGYIPGFVYMPTRDLVVYMWPSNSGTDTFPVRDGWVNRGQGDGKGCYMFPRISAYRLTGYNFPNSSWTATPFELDVRPYSSFQARDRLDQGLGDTGWPGYRSVANGRLLGGERTWKGATDSGCLMQGGAWGWLSHADSSKVRGINDGLDYCEKEDCLFVVERQPGPENGTSFPRANNHTIILWKLMPPPIGQEQPGAGVWTWVREILKEKDLAVGGSGIARSTEMPNWGGKTPYHPKVKCIMLTDRPNMPVQALRSKDWT